MNKYKLLDYLGSLSEEDRLVEIEKNADAVYSNKFIDLIKGQLQFAAKEAAGAGYFEKKYQDENAQTLKSLQEELREQHKRNSNVWLSMIKMNNGFNFREYFKNTSGKQNVSHADQEDLFDYDYCIKCGMAGGSETLCGQCMID